MFAATRSRFCGLAFMVTLLCACTAAPAWAAVPGGYSVKALDPPGLPDTVTGARAGEGVLNAGDVNKDGRDDVLVSAPSAPIDRTITGRVYMYSGASGELIWEAAPPSQQPAQIVPSDPTRFGAALARLGDIGQCTFGGASCTVSGQTDGAPEVLVSAPGTETGGDAGKDEGVVYVLDGATGRMLKDIRLATAERPAFDSGGFGKAVASLAGQPPCAGFAGIGPCLLSPGSAVATGDQDGGGLPDFVVGAPDYTEVGANFGGEHPGCQAPVDSCPGLGRVYLVRGELISGPSETPLAITSDIANFVQFPGPAGSGDPPRFGSALTPVGDVGRCAEDASAGGPTCVASPVPVTNVPDGRPDYLVSAPGDDVGATADAGAAFVTDAAGVASMLRVTSPTPQGGAAFGSFAQSFFAPGPLDGDEIPDLVVGAPGHDAQGAAYLANGDLFGADRLITSFSDPAPVADGEFGSSLAALGDVSGDGAGEVALGAAAGSRIGAVHMVSACARGIVQTITDPDPQTGAGFGAAVAPMGDLNGDGMLDLVVGVPTFDAGPVADRGRAYVFKSNGVAGPAHAGCGGGTSSGGGSDGGEAVADTPDDGTVVIARVLRRIAMKPDRKRVRKGSSFRLRGTLSASANRFVCQRRQKIAVQRRRAGGRFQTFEVAVTRASGKFTARAFAERTYVYRARVSQTARCMGAVSKTARVSILRKRGSR